MYCPKCGSQIPDDATYCTSCGKKVSENTILFNGEACKTAKKQAFDGPSAQNKKKCKKKPLILFAALVAIIAAVISAIGILGSRNNDKEISVPTIEQIEKMTNSLEGDDATFTEDNDTDFNAYYIDYGDERVGEIFLHAASEDIGIYIERDTTHAKDAFAKVCVGTMLACDRSLSLDKAKEILNKAVDRAKDDGNVSHNGVEYRATIPSWRYILRMDVPKAKDESEKEAKGSNSTSTNSKSHKSNSKKSTVSSETEANKMIKDGSARYAATHSESEIQKLTNSSSGYQKLSDEQKTAILVALGSSKAKELIKAEAKNHLKSPSSFKLESYSESFDPIYSDDESKYTVFSEMTYSGVNDYNVRKTRTVKNCTCDFTINLEEGTVTMNDASILDFILD